MNSAPNIDSRRSDRPQRARWRDDLYVIIFEADTRAGQLFDVALLLTIILSVIVISLETVQVVERSPLWMSSLHWLEWILTLLFTAEYVARLICVHRPLRYAFSFFGIVDLLACLPLYLTLMDVHSQSFMIIRSVRLLRVFRVLKMMRMLREAHTLKNAIWKSRDKVMVFIAVVMVAVTISGTIMYHVEHVVLTKSGTAQPGNPREDQFTSIPQSMYWAIVTMTTVGYGDIVPRTAVGKAISAALILLGYSLIIVPTGFVSAELHSQARSQAVSNTRVCPNCLREGHVRAAHFCYRCGSRLI